MPEEIDQIEAPSAKRDARILEQVGQWCALAREALAIPHKKAYQERSGFEHATVRRLESGRAKREMYNRNFEFWRQQEVAAPIRKVLDEAEEAVLDLLILEDGETSISFLDRLRLKVGGSTFEEKTGLKWNTVNKRNQTGTLGSFAELLRVPEQLGLRTEIKDPKELWKHPLTVRARGAWLNDMEQRKRPFALTELCMRLECAGLKIDETSIRAAFPAVPFNHCREMAAHCLVPVETARLILAGLVERGAMESAEADALAEQWATELEEQRLRPTFAGRATESFAEQGLKLPVVADILDVRSRHPEIHSVVEPLHRSLEGGFAPAAPRVVIAHLAARTAQELEELTGLGIGEQESDLRRKGSQLDTEVYVRREWNGVEYDDLPYRKARVQKLERRLPKHNLKRASVLDAVDRRGMDRVREALLRWLEYFEPSTAASAAETLPKKVGMRELTTRAHTSIPTVERLAAGETIPPLSVVQAIIREGGARVLPRVVREWHDTKAREFGEQTYVARALSCLVEARSVNGQEFLDDVLGHTMDYPTFRRRRESLGQAHTTAAALTDLLQGTLFANDNRLRTWFECLAQAEGPSYALVEWYRRMREAGDLEALRAAGDLLDSTMNDGDEARSKRRPSVQALLRRKFAVHQPAEESPDDPESLSAVALGFLPGLTSDELLEAHALLEEERVPATELPRRRSTRRRRGGAEEDAAQTDGDAEPVEDATHVLEERQAVQEETGSRLDALREQLRLATRRVRSHHRRAAERIEREAREEEQERLRPRVTVEPEARRDAVHRNDTHNLHSIPQQSSQPRRASAVSPELAGRRQERIRLHAEEEGQRAQRLLTERSAQLTALAKTLRSKAEVRDVSALAELPLAAWMDFARGQKADLTRARDAWVRSQREHWSAAGMSPIAVEARTMTDEYSPVIREWMRRTPFRLEPNTPEETTQLVDDMRGGEVFGWGQTAAVAASLELPGRRQVDLAEAWLRSASTVSARAQGEIMAVVLEFMEQSEEYRGVYFTYGNIEAELPVIIARQAGLEPAQRTGFTAWLFDRLDRLRGKVPVARPPDEEPTIAEETPLEEAEPLASDEEIEYPENRAG